MKLALYKKAKSGADAKAARTNLLQLLSIASVDQSTIEQALNLEIKDLEDTVPMIVAVQCKVDCLVTRNPKDYQPVFYR